MKAETAISRIKGWHKAISPYVSNDTGEDMIIEDRPASWGNHKEYRILSDGSNCFFSVIPSEAEESQKKYFKHNKLCLDH